MALEVSIVDYVSELTIYARRRHCKSPMTNARYQLRVHYTRAALAAHFVSAVSLSIIAGGAHSSVTNGTVLTLLIAQEWVALVGAMVAMVRLWWNEDENFFNTSKWAEYSVSATLGVFAIFTSGEGSAEAWVILVLVFLSSTQQILGRILDEVTYSSKALAQLVLAWAFQVTEFWVVAASAPSLRVPPYVVYVLMWSSFGVLCTARLYVAKWGWIPVWLGERWGSELLYTVLGWTSKLSLVVTTLPYVYGDHTRVSVAMAVLSLLGTAGAVYWTQVSAAKLYARKMRTVVINEEEDDGEAAAAPLPNPSDFA